MVAVLGVALMTFSPLQSALTLTIMVPNNSWISSLSCS